MSYAIGLHMFSTLVKLRNGYYFINCSLHTCKSVYSKSINLIKTLPLFYYCFTVNLQCASKTVAIPAIKAGIRS